jgi:hypothetical protein
LDGLLTAAQGTIGIVLATIASLIAGLTGVITFVRSLSRRARLRKNISETFDLIKAAKELGQGETSTKLGRVAARQVERLRIAEWRNEHPQRDGASLGAAIALLVILGPAAYGLFLVDFILTTILAWILVVFLLIFVPFGVVRFVTGDPRTLKEPPPADE